MANYGRFNGNSVTWWSDSVGGTISHLLDASVAGQVSLSGPAGAKLSLKNVQDPSASTDAATKQYVDSVAQGLDLKDSVRVATTAAGALGSDFENGDTVDGVVLQTGDRILIKNQTNAVENGIYIVQGSGSPSRSADMSTGSSAAGVYCFAREGTTNADTAFVCTTDRPSDVVGTNALTFTAFSHIDVTAGTNLNKVGQTLSLDNALSFAGGSLTDTSGAFSFSSNTVLRNLLDPVQDQDGATKAYVDTKAEALVVAAATDGALTLATDFENGDVVDGYTLVTSDLILIKDQASATENGVYIVQASGAPVRIGTGLFASGADAAAAKVIVTNGTYNSGYIFICTSSPAIVGTNGLSFATEALPAVQTRVVVGDTTITGGSVTSTSGTVSFGANDVTTTGGMTAASFTSSSDRRLKDAIVPIEDALLKVCRIRGVDFRWVANGEKDVGVIAQEVREVLSPAVHEGKDGFLKVDYGRLTCLLVNAIQELKAEVEHLKQKP